MLLLNGLTIVSSTGDVVWPHIPHLDGATDGFVLGEVDYRDILSTSSAWEMRWVLRHRRMQSPDSRILESYCPARSMSCHEVDMECDHVTSCVDLDLVGVVFVLVTAAEIQVALVTGVRYLDGILDRAGGV